MRYAWIWKQSGVISGEVLRAIHGVAFEPGRESLPVDIAYSLSLVYSTHGMGSTSSSRFGGNPTGRHSYLGGIIPEPFETNMRRIAA